MSENILKENGDHVKSKLCHFRDRMSVKHSTMETKHVCLFYGKDKLTDKNVVVRQFTGENVKQLIKEIKIYELISNQKVGEEKLVKCDKRVHIGLPQLVEYHVEGDCGEIIILYEGPSLDKWLDRIESK